MASSVYEDLVSSITAKAGQLSKSQREELKTLLDRLDYPRNYLVNIDYDRTVEDLVAAGKYNIVSSFINNEMFPSDESGRTDVPIYLVEFGRKIWRKEVLEFMSNMTPPLRPATLKELLTLGIAKPDLLHIKDIVALGSGRLTPDSWLTIKYPVLQGFMRARIIMLRGLPQDYWESDVCFAAVLK